MNKNTGVFILGFVIVFFIFISEESIRLKYYDKDIPIIVLDRTKYCVTCLKKDERVRVEYQSLLFKTDIEYKGLGNGEYQVLGKEFRLFNTILIWAWIE